MADLRTHLCGIQLANPFIAASGPLSYGARGIKRLFEGGAAAAVTKTIAPIPAENPVPHILTVRGGSMLNTEKWADLSVQQWIDNELPSLSDCDGVVVASMGHSPDAVSKLTPMLVNARAVKLLEVTSYHARDMVPMVQVVKDLTDVPVFIKACADWADFYGVIDRCVAAGVDGVTAGDAFGPVLRIDIEKARPAMGGNHGYARLSGPAIKLLWVRIVADVRRRYPNLPIVATGGVSNAKDAVEMLMAGATAVGACTAPMLKGPQWFQNTTDSLNQWLDQHGYESLSAVRGKALSKMVAGEDTTPLVFSFDPDRCTECGRCVTVCAYEARQMAALEMKLDQDACRSCGLCVSVCPSDAITIEKK